MKERMIPSTCPHCGHVFQIKRDTMAVAGMNPIIDERLSQETYFTHQCSHCHRLYCIEQPFLYHDPEKRYLILLSNQEKFGPLPKDEMVIRCKNVLQFYFVYKVLSQGLSLRMVMVKKKRLEAKRNESVRFESYDASHHCLWFLSRKEWLAVSLSPEEEGKIKG